MNKGTMMLKVAAVSVLLAAAGCMNARYDRSKYLPTGEKVSGIPERATVYDLDAAVQELMSQMRTHASFIRSYEEFKQKNNRKPILQILPIGCRCSMFSSYKGRLGIVHDKIGQSIFESDLFVLRDDVLTDALQKTAGQNQVKVPDCALRGLLTRVREEGRCYVYRLQLILSEAKSGDILWQGEVTIQKTDWIFR